jgi:1-acyl-sn-glycerol-3-phosphate acyltransferase
VIVPATLTYKSIDDLSVTPANRDLIYWYGDMDFISHFWRLLALRSIEVLVTIQPPIECFDYEDNSAGRKKLAEDCYNLVLGRTTEAADEADDLEEGAEPLLPT